MKRNSTRDDCDHAAKTISIMVTLDFVNMLEGYMKSNNRPVAQNHAAKHRLCT